MHNHLQFDPIWIMLCSEKMPLADRPDAIPTKCDWWVSPNTLTNDSIEFESNRRNQTTHLLIEVNLSGDPARTGCMMSDTPRLVEFAQSKPHCCVKGLMGMAGISEDIGAARRDFSRLRVERDRIAGTNTAQLPELSMGMTADFEDAILEGATIVRIGSALWQGVLKQGSHD
ncbi:MAG: alanine racemase [Planctomycetia bacterium]|nr:alanine racemase [Planctomycetia bacterium]